MSERLHWWAYRALCWLYPLAPDVKARINDAAMWCWDRSTARPHGGAAATWITATGTTTAAPSTGA